MSVVTGPYALKGGGTIRIPLPKGTLLVRAVVIGNTTLASVVVTVTGSTRVVFPGSADLFVIESGSSGVKVTSLGGTGSGGTVQATWFTPAEVPKSGYPLSASRSSFTTFTTKITTVRIIPVVATVGVYTGRVTLKGLTAPVAIIPSTRNETYFSNLKIGWGVWGDLANTHGPDIYVGDSAGGTTAAGWARFPSGKTKIIGSFKPATGGASWGNAWVARVAGTTGDICNVWAA